MENLNPIGNGAVAGAPSALGKMGSVRQTHLDPPATRSAPDALDLGAELIGCGVCGGSCTGLSTLKSCCPVQSQPLAYTGAVAVLARASTDPTIALIFDFMGRLLLRD
jgi:hypothetical protein